MSQFYAIVQEVNETVPQFVIRFQNLRKQLTRSPTPEELTEIFLTGLHETLRTTLQVVDLSGQPIEEVIRRVLRLDSAQSMSMTSLQDALCIPEETRFKQVVQCTTCLNPELSALDCTLRMHCPICHLIEIDHLVRSATTESWKYVPNQSQENSEQCRDTRYNVENPQSGKNHDSPQAVK